MFVCYVFIYLYLIGRWAPALQDHDFIKATYTPLAIAKLPENY